VFNIIALGSGTIFAVGILLIYIGIKCPKCNKILGLKFVFAEETLIHCPRCGINFDEDSLEDEKQ
jgi:phage FluMu protein Com